jgi:hypothetical protein
MVCDTNCCHLEPGPVPAPVVVPPIPLPVTQSIVVNQKIISNKLVRLSLATACDAVDWVLPDTADAQFSSDNKSVVFAIADGTYLIEAEVADNSSGNIHLTHLTKTITVGAPTPTPPPTPPSPPTPTPPPTPTNVVTIIEYSGPNCGACNTMAPVVADMISKGIPVTQSTNYQADGITMIPTFVLQVNGKTIRTKKKKMTTGVKKLSNKLDRILNYVCNEPKDKK